MLPKNAEMDMPKPCVACFRTVTGMQPPAGMAPAKLPGFLRRVVE
jgi:hypothetical protein